MLKLFEISSIILYYTQTPFIYNNNNSNNIIYMRKRIRAPFDTPVPVSVRLRIVVVIIIHIILYTIGRVQKIYIYIICNITNPFYEYIL